MSWTGGSVMTREVKTVRPDTPCKEIVERMCERRISAMPVVDSAGRVVGIVSEADLMLKEESPHQLGGPPVEAPWGRGQGDCPRRSRADDLAGRHHRCGGHPDGGGTVDAPRARQAAARRRRRRGVWSAS
jgi:hypothetical protein